MAARPAAFTRRSLRRARGKVTIAGTLSGAAGGELITISTRPVKGGRWTSRTVLAGANGGSFSAAFAIGSTAVFVAQWAGDSGRGSVGSPALLVRVR